MVSWNHASGSADLNDLLVLDELAEVASNLALAASEEEAVKIVASEIVAAEPCFAVYLAEGLEGFGGLGFVSGEFQFTHVLGFLGVLWVTPDQFVKVQGKGESFKTRLRHDHSHPHFLLDFGSGFWLDGTASANATFEKRSCSFRLPVVSRQYLNQ
jgi:hypothetical protein